MMFMIPTPPTIREMEAMTVSMPEMIERREPAGWRLLLPLMRVKPLSPFLVFDSSSLILLLMEATESEVSVRTLICWI